MARWRLNRASEREQSVPRPTRATMIAPGGWCLPLQRRSGVRGVCHAAPNAPFAGVCCQRRRHSPSHQRPMIGPGGGCSYSWRIPSINGSLPARWRLSPGARCHCGRRLDEAHGKGSGNAQRERRPLGLQRTLSISSDAISRRSPTCLWEESRDHHRGHIASGRRQACWRTKSDGFAAAWPRICDRPY